VILLDTHAFIWLASDQRKLSKTALKLLQQPEQTAAISIVTAWEIAILTKRNRLELPVAPDAYVDRALKQHRLSELPLSRDVIFDAVQLPDIHNDPFDRILVATARAHHMTLISKDKIIARYPDIDVVW
jgi:PIN domain nuclease of toxin-antitoxin system